MTKLGSKIGNKRYYPKRLRDIEQEEDAKEEIKEVIDHENQGVSCRKNNVRIPLCD